MRRNQRYSRLTRTSEKQNKRQAVIFAAGIIFLLLILIQFGPILINVFGNIVYNLRGGDAAEKQITGSALLQPPILNGVPSATQSAQISFSGIAPDKKGTVEIYLNDELEDEIDLDNKTQFSVNINVKKGDNIVKARYSINGKTSPFTDDFPVKYITEKPKLDVSFPTDGANFTKADKSINVTGDTDPENTVTVNGFRAIVDSNGHFSYLLQLNDGDNQIQIEAQNQAGIANDKSLKVTYHQ